MSTPDRPRPYPADYGRDDREWNGSGNGRGRSSGYRAAASDGRRRGSGTGYGGGRGWGQGGRDARGGDAYGGGRRDAGRRDGYGRSGWQRLSDRATGSWQRVSDQATGSWQRVSDRAARGDRRGGRDSWDRDGGRSGRAAMRAEAPGRGERGAGARDWRGPGRARGQQDWGATSVRERVQARAGGQYRGDGRLRGLGERQPGGGRGNGGGPGGYGPRPRRKGDWWRYWTWKKALTVAGIAAGVCVVIGAAGVGIVYAQTVIPTAQASVFQQASTVYFSDGKTMIGQFGSTNRQLLTYNQIPAVMKNAMVAAEDKNFYHEGGISPTGIVRALYYDLTRSGGAPQGASTLTQEMVRQYYDNIGTQQTISRKIKEIFVAEKLAQRKSKAWILTTYLNTVDFGSGQYGDAYGAGAAAQFYFGEPISKLTPGQAAMIAAMPQAPSYYYTGIEGPHPDPQARGGLIFRWHYVLKTMLTMGTLSQQQYDQTLKQGFPKIVKPVNNSWSGATGYLMMAVYRELRNTYHYTDRQINNGGLHIVSTFNARLEKGLYATVGHMKTLMRDCSPPSTAVTGGGNAVANGYACNPSHGWQKWTNIGAVLQQPSNGAILAMYGGPDYSKQQYDDALVARSQVGSSFKPYVLATAVSQGMNVQTSKLNGYSPLYIPPTTEPLVYASQRPRTTGGWFGPIANDEAVPSQGPVPVYKATAESLNTAFTDLYHRVAGSPQDDKVVAMAKSFGVNVGAAPPQGDGSGLQDMAGEVGIALGQASLTVGEQANTVATLANGGTYYTPHVIRQITAGNQVIPAKVDTHQVLTAQQAADVDWAMGFDTQPGLGTAPYQGMDNGQQIIAKTGTTNLAQQAFFMGATPRYAMAVGMFVSESSCPKIYQQACQSKSSLSYAPPLGHGMQTLFGIGGLAGYGGGWPAAIWHAYFNQEFASVPVQPWPTLNTAGMSTWNLVGQLPKPKPHPHPTQPNVGPTCFGFGRKCRGGGPTPVPTSPNPTPTSCVGPFCPSTPPPTTQPTPPGG